MTEMLVPAIAELPHGVLRTALPTPFPVGDVNCYVILGSPVTVVDPGMIWQGSTDRIEAFLAEAGGTVLHFGNDFATTLPPWGPPAPESGRIDGMSLQVIRPASGVRADVLATNTRHYVLTEDGGCLGLAIGGQMITLSASDGTQRSYVIGADTFDGVDAFAFAARPGTTLLAQ